MIQTQSVVSVMLSELDAEGSDRYLFDQDFKPAINSAISWLVSVFNRAYGDNKLPEENLRDLLFTKVFQANEFSRVKIDPSSIGHKVWSIVGVYPQPVVYPDTVPPTQVSPEISVFRNDLSFIKSKHSAGRLSLEQWNEGGDNPFLPGNSVLSGSLLKYGYVNKGESSSSNYQSQKEIEIRPDVPGQFVGVSYIKYPSKVTTITSQIEFPESLENMIVQRALMYIAVKQGDRTNLFSVTSSDISTLLKVMS